MDLSKIKFDIPSIVYEWGEKHATSTNYAFVGVLSHRYGEIVERAFAVRRYAKKGLMITEVRRRATGNKSDTILKNLLFGKMCGYIPVFEKEDKYSNGGGWCYKVFSKEDFDKWYVSDKSCNFNCICLNKDILTRIDEFKYCGYSNGDVIEFLNEYRANPLVEFFGKYGLPLSSLLISQANKDKRFRAYLLKNASDVCSYGSRATIYAYKHSMTISEANEKLIKKRRALADIPALRGQKLDYERIVAYCETNNIGFRIYNDYLEAVIALGLDTKDTKNIYPKDFIAMHDMRIAEHEGIKAKVDRAKRKELYESFAKAGEKATVYEYSDKVFSMIAPRDISDLVIEGKTLGHCVGERGYDKKMADGKVVIMFLRQARNPQKPFVTIEYDLQKSRLLQAYGEKNTSAPNDAVVFINEWVEMMKKLKKTNA